MSNTIAPGRSRAPVAILAVTALLALALAGALPPTAGADDALSLPGERVTAVEVRITSEAERAALFATALDITDVEADSAEIFLYSEDDAAALRAAGFDWTVVDHDRSEQAAALSAARDEEEALAQQLESTPGLASTLPSGRVSYRTLDEIEAELHELAATYPDRVKLFELPHRSLLDRPIYGVEIARDPHVESGKPVFLNTGIHHSREWPVAEFPLEFAWDVLAGDGADPRITRLMDEAKMIVVPVVNPDGFYMSRERIHEQKRKNCRIAPGQIPTFEQCAAGSAANRGVDLNRNYGAFWGGPGSSGSQTSGTYRGEAPYSEPEIKNMVELTAAHQVMVAIHNHTPDGRLLRAPSSPEEPVPVADAGPYDALAQSLGAALDWPAGPWTEVYYVASGVAEQHAYYSAGIFGFTTEATPGHSGLARFHPPYEYVIDQYDGTGSYEGSSMREAFLLAWEATADPAQHSVVTGTAPRGIELTISKSVTLNSSTVNRPGLGSVVIPSDVDIETTMVVPASGAFEWHVLPSLRPSQYHSTHLAESWTISCRNPAGRVHASVEVTVARGGTADVDLSDCPGGPQVSPPPTG